MAQERITVDPNRMRGLPCIRDTRVIVSTVLGQLAAGTGIDELLADHPYLEREDVLAALEYAGAAHKRELEVASIDGVKLLLDRTSRLRSCGSSRVQDMLRSTSQTLAC